MFLTQLEKYKINLIHKKRQPENFVEIIKDDSAFLGFSAKIIGKYSDFTLKPKESVVVDFSTHYVGYLHYSAVHIDRIQDAPFKLKFTFGETVRELIEPEKYDGKLSASWIQQEESSMVFLPSEKTLERRYAFRYLKIERIDDIDNTVKIRDLYLDSVTSADEKNVKELKIDGILKDIDRVAVKTLMECEQTVFEDGPKRDRRLWVGDLRLQCLADYMTFKNYDLIKRCLYLCAEYRIAGKIIAPCLFENSPPHIDEWWFPDYALFYISTLYDYMLYGDTDLTVIADLYPVAYEQMLAVKPKLHKETKTADNLFFIDWCPKLDSNVARFGIYLYATRQLKAITEFLNKETNVIDAEIAETEKVLKSLFNKDILQFEDVNNQKSWANQVWGVLSGVLDKETAKKVLAETERLDPEYKMGTPYMVSYYIEALLYAGDIEKAKEVIKKYWGEMLSTGLDCFPEYLITAPERSFLYNEISNSYCHAWSATPAYFIRKIYDISK